jgi:hypothetical protein
MTESLFRFAFFVVLPFVIGRLLFTKPTLLIRLITNHIDTGDTDQTRSNVQENVYWARTDAQVWSQKYPQHVQLLKSMGMFFYAMSTFGLIGTLGTLLTLIW